MAKLARSPELLGALVSGFGEATMKDFTSRPAEFITAAGISPKVEVQTVENTDDTINVALPFYSTLVKSAGSIISDSDMESVSGGAAATLSHDAGILVSRSFHALQYGNKEEAAAGKTALRALIDGNKADITAAYDEYMKASPGW